MGKQLNKFVKWTSKFVLLVVGLMVFGNPSLIPFIGPLGNGLVGQVIGVGMIVGGIATLMRK